MALDSYGNLRLSICAELVRTGDAEVFAASADWITLCEADFRAELSLLPQETNAALTPSAGPDSYPIAPLPTGYAGAKRMYYDQQPTAPLTYIEPNQLRELYGFAGPTTASVYTVEGANFVFPPGTGTAAIRLLFEQQFAPLSDAAPTNFVLATHPGIYLYGALLHSSPYLLDDSRMPVWESLYGARLDLAKKLDRKQKYPGPLRVRSQVSDRPEAAPG